MFCENSNNLIAAYHISLFINNRKSIGITVQTDTNISAVFMDTFLGLFRMKGTTI